MQTTTRHCELSRVRGVRPCRRGTGIAFANGTTVCVPAGAPRAEQIIASANAGCLRGDPVGVLLTDAREVLDLSPARVSTVAFVRPGEDRADRFMVGFWAFGTLCYLMKDHPDFERVYRTLQEAPRTETQILFANPSWPIEDEEASWWQLMDARPVEPLFGNGSA